MFGSITSEWESFGNAGQQVRNQRKELTAEGERLELIRPHHNRLMIFKIGKDGVLHVPAAIVHQMFLATPGRATFQYRSRTVTLMILLAYRILISSSFMITFSRI